MSVYPDPSAVEEALHIHRTTDIHILSEEEQLRLDRLIYGAARAYVELIGGGASSSLGSGEAFPDKDQVREALEDFAPNKPSHWPSETIEDYDYYGDGTSERRYALTHAYGYPMCRNTKSSPLSESGKSVQEADQ